MKVKEKLIPTPKEIQLVRDEIRRSWSFRERDKRGRLAESRQAQLFAVLFSRPATVPARVA
jgi:hypothetical protein